MEENIGAVNVELSPDDSSRTGTSRLKDPGARCSIRPEELQNSWAAEAPNLFWQECTAMWGTSNCRKQMMTMEKQRRTLNQEIHANVDDFIHVPSK